MLPHKDRNPAMNVCLGRCRSKIVFCVFGMLGLFLLQAVAQNSQGSPRQTQGAAKPTPDSEQDFNQQLQRLVREAEAPADASAEDYRIGSGDLLDISVFDAPDLNRTVRVAADGEVTVPLLGDIHAAGLSTHELESVLDELLRRNYMTDPHVSVFVREMESHAISVLGGVQKPGVYQIRCAKSLIEVLSMSQGLADDAGDTVIVVRHGAASSTSSGADPPDPMTAAGEESAALSVKAFNSLPATVKAAHSDTIEIKLKDLLNSSDRHFNVMVNPGDAVKVPRAGIVYVVGEVHKPGGFVLKSNENVSVLQALAMAEGTTHTASAKQARIIRTDRITDERSEIPVDLNRILAGRAPDPMLRPKDILFIPNSTGKAALFRGTEAALSIAGGIIVYRR